jgi:hypothetical protein
MAPAAYLSMIFLSSSSWSIHCTNYAILTHVKGIQSLLMLFVTLQEYPTFCLLKFMIYFA